MMRVTIAWALPLFVLSACGDGKKEAAEEIEDEDSIAPVHPDGSEEDSDDYSS